MSEYDSDILRLGKQGYCCSQILLLLALEMQGEENVGLVRAMQGLCEESGNLERICGVLSGGHALLAYYLGKGRPSEKADHRLGIFQKELLNWFTAKNGSRISCGAIAPDPATRLSVCPELIGSCAEQLFTMLTEAGIELDQVKEEL